MGSARLGMALQNLQTVREARHSDLNFTTHQLSTSENDPLQLARQMTEHGITLVNIYFKFKGTAYV